MPYGNIKRTGWILLLEYELRWVGILTILGFANVGKMTTIMQVGERMLDCYDY
jgi:hypothetical protein